MNILNFFDFCSKYSSATIRVSGIELDNIPPNLRDTATEFDHNRLIFGVYESFKFPIIFKQEGGKKFEDLLNTGWPSLYLISDKLRFVLEENHITGWKTFPIKLLDKKGSEIPGYQGFSITGRCGPIDNEKSEIIEKRKPSTAQFMRKFYKGLYVGLDKWDGNDFFLPKGTLWIIISEKASKIIKKNKTTNIQLTNLTEIERPKEDI